MTMKILSPTERQNIEQGKRARVREVNELLSTGKVKFPGIRGWLPESAKRDESVEAKPLDYVEPYRGAKLVNVTHDEVPAGLASGFAINAQLEYLEAQNANARDEYEKRFREHCEKLLDAFPAFPKATTRPAKPRYFGSDLAAEAEIARNMEAYNGDYEWKKAKRAEPIFHPTSLSAFVQDHRIMRKGPWK